MTAYEWYQGTTKLTTGITGNKGETYSKANAAAAYAGEYHCKAIDRINSADSDPKTIVVVGRFTCVRPGQNTP